MTNKQNALSPDQLVTRIKLLGADNETINSMIAYFNHINYQNYVIDSVNNLLVSHMIKHKSENFELATEDLKNNIHDIAYDFTKEKLKAVLVKKESNLLNFNETLQRKQELQTKGYIK